MSKSKDRPKRPRGRPTEYSGEVAERICARMADGESLRSICSDPSMPADSTVRLWAVMDREGFSAHYARAREVQVERWADEIIEISDDSDRDTFTDSEGNERTDHEVVARSRLRVDSRKWLMSKLAPKRYGDRQVVEHSGEVTIGGLGERIDRAQARAGDGGGGDKAD